MIYLDFLKICVGMLLLCHTGTLLKFVGFVFVLFSIKILHP